MKNERRIPEDFWRQNLSNKQLHVRYDSYVFYERKNQYSQFLDCSTTWGTFDCDEI